MVLMFLIAYIIMGIALAIVRNLWSLRERKVVTLGDLFEIDELDLLLLSLWPFILIGLLVMVILYPFGLLMEKLSKIVIYERESDD